MYARMLSSWIILFTVCGIVYCLHPEGHSVHSRHDEDPSQSAAACLFQDNSLDCSARGLSSIPSVIPPSSTANFSFNSLSGYVVFDLFFGEKHVKKVDFSHNQIEEISFNAECELEQLLVDSNHLLRLSASVCLNLKQLSANGNELSSINSSLFPRHLEQLLLARNRIVDLPVLNLPALRKLVLQHNRIDSISKNAFQHLQNVRFLDLSSNGLKRIHGLQFNGLSQLRTLKLNGNALAVLDDGAFFGLKRLKTLDLSSNRLPAISKGCFYELPKLKYLILTQNDIHSIDSSGWKYLPSLSELHLDRNQLGNLSSNTFEQLDNLSLLNLSRNHLSSIEFSAFTTVPHLVHLDLSSNNLSTMLPPPADDGELLPLGELKRLDLASNQIRMLIKMDFLKRIEEINLVGNEIVTVDREFGFSSITSLKRIEMQTASLFCDCNFVQFRQWLQKDVRMVEPKMRLSLVCSEPARLKNVSLLEVNENELICDSHLKPTFVLQPQSKVLIEGNSEALSCAVEIRSAVSSVNIYWRKDGTMLYENQRVGIRTEWSAEMLRFSSSLLLRNVSFDDEGSYECVYSGPVDSVTSQKANIQVSTLPVLVKAPIDVTVKAGSTARLQCRAIGQPIPEISWTKDGGEDFPAARERRMHVMPSDDVFFIVNVQVHDEGLYSCHAHNNAGRISANATLRVLDPPNFEKRMEDVDAPQGETAVFECLSRGSPRPSLVWLRDGDPLDVTSRHFFAADNQLLVIVNTASADEGVYGCEIENPLGVKSQFAQLKVIPKLSPKLNLLGLDDNSFMTGVIVIAVVCCIVGTSLIWVLVIYRTRRRRRLMQLSGTSSTYDHRAPGDGGDPPTCTEAGTLTPTSLGTNNTLTTFLVTETEKETLYKVDDCDISPKTRNILESRYGLRRSPSCGIMPSDSCEPMLPSNNCSSTDVS